jgi:hypothetical protein
MSRLGRSPATAICKIPPYCGFSAARVSLPGQRERRAEASAGPFFRAGTRKKGLGKGEQTPEEQTEDGRKAYVHEAPPAILTRHQETDAPLHVHILPPSESLILMSAQTRARFLVRPQLLTRA